MFGNGGLPDRTGRDEAAYGISLELCGKMPEGWVVPDSAFLSGSGRREPARLPPGTSPTTALSKKIVLGLEWLR